MAIGIRPPERKLIASEAKGSAGRRQVAHTTDERGRANPETHQSTCVAAGHRTPDAAYKRAA